MGIYTEEFNIRMYAVYLVKMARKFHTYRELSSLTGLQGTVLARYVKDWVVPLLGRAEKIIEVLEPEYGLSNALMKMVELDGDGFFNKSRVLYDTDVMWMAGYDVVRNFKGFRVTKVLAPAVDGVPLATSIALTLRVPIVVAKTEGDVGVAGFENITCVSGDSAKTFYVPKGAVRDYDDVLVVDGVARSGEVLEAMVGLVEKAKARLSGIYVLVCFRDALDRLKRRGDVRVVYGLLVEPKRVSKPTLSSRLMG
jgi:adenine/guanine phosphoribosyltransferase-like PRPP-binding protein